MLFVSKIKIIWRREWRGGAGEGPWLPLLCLCLQEELARFGGLLASWRALGTGSANWLFHTSSPGDLQDLLWPISDTAGASHKGLGPALLRKGGKVPEAHCLLQKLPYEAATGRAKH